MKRHRFLVVGLGTLGQSVARALADDGAEVIALDTSPILVNQIKDTVAVAVEGNATDSRVLEQLGVADIDAAIVCIGEHFEANVLAVAHLLDLGVRHVAARVNTETAAGILKRVGAHEVFFIEEEMGKVIAHKLRQPTLLTEMDLGGGYRIIQFEAPEMLWGKSVVQLALPKNFHVQIVAILQEEDQSVRKVEPNTVIEKGNRLLLSGFDRDLSRFLDSFK